MTILYEPSQPDAEQVVPLLAPPARRVSASEELNRLTAAGSDELLVVFGPGADSQHALSFAAERRVSQPMLGVVLVRHEMESTLLAEAMRSGVREVVSMADPAEVREACERSLQLSRLMRGVPASPAAASHGKVVTVFAGKGGCGKTTIASNLAIMLAAGGSRRVLLVDLDLSFGDMAIMLQLVPTRSIAAAVDMADQLDETGLRSLLTPHSAGVETLLAPAGPTEGERVTRDLVSAILRLARTMFDYIVVDTPPLFTDQALAALDASHWYVVPATPDVPTLKNVRVTLDTFDELGYPKEQRLVVLNRADFQVGLTAADIERVVKAPIVAHIPSSRDVPISINRGVPLTLEKPNHPVSRAVRQIAFDWIMRDAAPAPAEPAKTRRGLMAWRGR